MKAHSELIRCCCPIDSNSGQGSPAFPASSVGVENLRDIHKKKYTVHRLRKKIDCK